MRIISRCLLGAAALAVLAVLPTVVPSQQSGLATYEIDATHSSVVFKVKHLGVAWFYGRFNDLSGSITVDEADLANSSIEVTIQATSVDTNNGRRDDHLRSQDFFNAVQFPTITFQSTGIEKVEGDDRYELSGELTMLGKTLPVTADLEYTGTGENRRGTKLMGAEASFMISRSAFGMGFMPGGLSDEVYLTVSIEAARQ